MLLESILESEFALLLEYDTKVETYFEQPETFFLVDEKGVKLRYTPDFLVIHSNGQRKYIEVKPEHEVESGKYTKTFDLFKQKTLQTNSDFEVVTENTIKQEPLLRNLKFFYKYRKQKSIDLSPLNKLSNNLQNPKIFEELTPILDLKSLYELIAFGYIQFDIHNEVFSVTSKVWLNDK